MMNDDSVLLSAPVTHVNELAGPALIGMLPSLVHLSLAWHAITCQNIFSEICLRNKKRQLDCDVQIFAI